MTSSQSDPIKFVPKGWGYEKWIANCHRYCGKLLWFAKDRQCSWHYHKLKDEVFYIQSGKIMLYYGDSDDIKNCHTKILEQGDKFHIPTGMRHRIHAFVDSEVFEFSTEHFDEDSIRVEKGD